MPFQGSNRNHLVCIRHPAHDAHPPGVPEPKRVVGVGVLDTITRVNLIQALLYPELTMFPSQRDARTALRRCTRGLGYMLLAWLVLGPIMIYYAVAHDMMKSVTRHGPIITGLVIGGTPLSLLILAQYTLRSRTRRKLRFELRKIGIRICLNCGYDLCATTGAICSECGAVDIPLDSEKEGLEKGEKEDILNMT